MYDTAFGNTLCGRPLGGILLWMIAAGTYPDYDSFTCRIPGTEEPCGPQTADKAAVNLVLDFAQRFLALNRDRVIPISTLQGRSQLPIPCCISLFPYHTDIDSTTVSPT